MAWPRSGAHDSLDLAGRRRDQPRQVVALQGVEPVAIGQVEVDRRDGDLASGHRGQVGVRSRRARSWRHRRCGTAAGRPCPRRSAPARRGRPACRAGPTSTPVGSTPGTLMLSSVPAGSGTASSSATSRAVNLAAALEVESGAGAKVEIERRRVLRDRDPRQSQHDRLERGRHRARVGDVVAEVRAVVDAGDDELGLEALDQPQPGQAHAVDRGSVGGEADSSVGKRRAPGPTAGGAW